MSPSIVTILRANTSSFLLIASLMATIGHPIFAAAVHDVCRGTEHTCAKLAPEACCCAGQLSTKPPPVPKDVAYAERAPAVGAGDVPVARLDVVTQLLRDEFRRLTRHPALCILLGDLRL